MLIPDLQLIKLRLVVPVDVQFISINVFWYFSSFIIITIFLHSLFKDILEDVFESAIIGFQNGVLCAHVEWPLLGDGILEAAVCKACNRLQRKKGSWLPSCVISSAEVFNHPAHN